ncbi:hypothetical protein [Nocardia wallacei]|uniref:hypothetical protein n=1 Tax=Nocardia wallacei TaxID=480035 RepID=UPI00245551C6|nr:hypothetical protein [Nocardia wallacei]
MTIEEFIEERADAECRRWMLVDEVWQYPNAIRALAELHYADQGGCATCRTATGRPEGWPCATAKVMATAWSKHPAFREEREA